MRTARVAILLLGTVIGCGGSVDTEDKPNKTSDPICQNGLNCPSPYTPPQSTSNPVNPTPNTPTVPNDPNDPQTPQNPQNPNLPNIPNVPNTPNIPNIPGAGGSTGGTNDPFSGNIGNVDEWIKQLNGYIGGAGGTGGIPGSSGSPGGTNNNYNCSMNGQDGGESLKIECRGTNASELNCTCERPSGTTSCTAPQNMACTFPSCC